MPSSPRASVGCSVHMMSCKRLFKFAINNCSAAIFVKSRTPPFTITVSKLLLALAQQPKVLARKAMEPSMNFLKSAYSLVEICHKTERFGDVTTDNLQVVSMILIAYNDPELALALIHASLDGTQEEIMSALAFFASQFK